MVANSNSSKDLVLLLQFEPKEDVDIGYEQQYDDLNVVVAEKDLWYFEDDHIIVNVVDHEDEISYSTK